MLLAYDWCGLITKNDWCQKNTRVSCVIANNEQKTTVNRQQSKSYIQLKVSDTNT